MIYVQRNTIFQVNKRTTKFRPISCCNKTALYNIFQILGITVLLTQHPLYTKNFPNPGPGLQISTRRCVILYKILTKKV